MMKPKTTGAGQMRHTPVLLQEAIAYVKECSPELILDCCFGGGGHSRAFLEQTRARVIAVDQDAAAIERAEPLKREFGDRFELVSMNYSAIDSIQENNFCVVFFDLGLSSFQLDEADRGFSFLRDAPADMRMNTREGIPASEFLEKAPYDDLVKAVREYGEERNWKKIVNAIDGARGTGILSRTVSLARLIESVVPARRAPGRRPIHPATRTFQGIRMMVNDELGHLERSLPKSFDMLREGGRLIVIAFHSLEDRIVKRSFRTWAGFAVDRYDATPRQERTIVADLVTRKPLRPDEEEVARNPRSRSAVMRVLEKRSISFGEGAS